MRIIDVRYSLLPNELDALWRIKLNPSAPDLGVDYQVHRDRQGKTQRFWQMLLGRDLTTAKDQG